MALLEARGLKKQYGGRVVVNGVDLAVNAGEIVGLLGPNGAGKTTTFRIIVGMIAPNAGKVVFNGQDITYLAMYKRARLGLGYLAQDSSVFRKLTVEQNLYAILELMTTRRGQPYRSTRRERRERVDELLERFGLTRLRKNLAVTLSGGERRRLEIARCLVSTPMLIMLDEPFTGIDPITVNDIQGIIQELRESGIGVLITDHHVAETLRITDRSYIIADGGMFAHGTPLEIINNPQARAIYLGDGFTAATLGKQVERRQAG
jgi:lipopolysaccharide export system ATP-binding protein